MKTIIALFNILYSWGALADTNAYSVESAIYKIEVPYYDESRVGFGTGVLISPNKILTNCHVLDAHAGWPVAVQRTSGAKFRVLQHYNLGSYDACILKGHFPGTPIDVSNSINYGEPVWAYGYPRGISSIGQGTLSKLVDTDRGKSILSALFCDKGSSGGPLLNAKGQLIGLNYGVFQYRNQCLSIPAFMLKPYLGN